MAQTFGPDNMSREDLVKGSAEYLEEKGHGNKMRAHYINLLAKEVIGSKNLLFRHLQAKVHVSNSDAWDNAFKLVSDYLTENKLDYTKEIMEIEFKDCKPPEPGRYPDKNSEEYLDEIYGLGEERESFDDRVQTFKSQLKNFDEESTPKERPSARLSNPTEKIDIEKNSLATAVPEDNSYGADAFLTQPVSHRQVPNTVNNSPPSSSNSSPQKVENQAPTAIQTFGDNSMSDDDFDIDIDDDDAPPLLNEPKNQPANITNNTIKPAQNEIDDDDLEFAFDDDDD